MSSIPRCKTGRVTTAAASTRPAFTSPTKARETVKRIAKIERGRSEKFFVEIGPLKNFYPAEEYHQNYLEKNPNGYCHIPRAEMELFSRLRIDPGDYQKPAAESIRDKLTAEQYRVTQESGTERPFTGEFWDKFEKGIYVDVVTGVRYCINSAALRFVPYEKMETEGYGYLLYLFEK